MGAEPRVELPAPHVHSVDVPRPPLQQAVGEAAGGGAHVEADAIRRRDAEDVQRSGQLLAASPDERRHADDLERGVGAGQPAGLVRPLPPEPDAARHDQPARLGTRRRQSPFHEQLVQPDSPPDPRGHHRATRDAHGPLRHSSISFAYRTTSSRARGRALASAITWKSARSGSGIAATQSSPRWMRTPSITSTTWSRVASSSRSITDPFRSCAQGTWTRTTWVTGNSRASASSRASRRTNTSRSFTVAIMASKASWNPGKTNPPRSSPT